MRPLARLTRNTGLIIVQERKDLYRTNSGSRYTLAAAKEDPFMCENPILNFCAVVPILRS